MGIGNIISELAFRLSGFSDTPELDSQVILAAIMDRPRSWILAHPEVELTSPHQTALADALSRLEAGVPLPYVLGHWEFYGLDLLITPDVLIPRPETELLVDRALMWLRKFPAKRSALDIGTGSGCIGVSLAVNVPGLLLTLTDISPAALDVARCNAMKFGLDEWMVFHCCDLFPLSNAEEFQRRDATLRPGHLPPFDLIIANLPYIPSTTLQDLPIFGREPSLALDGGADGLDLIRRLLAGAPNVLAPGGMILMEIEASQGLAASTLAQAAFPDAEIHLYADLSGRDRLVEIQV